MTDDRVWTRYWRYLTRAFRSEVREEMDYHLEQRAKDLEAEGLSREAARQEALRRFGDPDKVQERLERIERKRGRRITLGFLTAELGQDIRYGVRGLLKRPGFTLATATSLALGIAAITVVLSLVDSWLLRPLPVRHARELVVIGASNRGLGPVPASFISLPTYRDIAARTDLFEEAATVRFAVVGARRAEAQAGERRMLLTTSGNYFSVLGVSAWRGRLFTPDDDRQGERVIVLNHHTWQNSFGADPSAIGSTLYLNTVPFVVIGVTPPGFKGTELLLESYGFIPNGVLGAIEPMLANAENERGGDGFKVYARRRPGVSMAAIRAGIDVLTGQLTSSYPELAEGYKLQAFAESRARPTLETGIGALSGAFVFSTLALLVLLTAAVNATNLILIRGTARQAELAVRQALGASRSRVIRQMVVETMLVAGLALGGGWFLARLAVGTLTSIPLVAGSISMDWAIAVDWRVFGLAVAITAIVGLVAGIAPAVTVSRFDLQKRLREGARGGMGRRGQRIRRALVVSQVAASMVVLIAVALFGTSARHAARIDLGFRPDHVVTFGVDPTLAHYDNTRALLAYDRIELKMRGQPGVVATAWANSVAMSAGSGVGDMFEVETEGTTQATRDGTLQIMSSAVSPAWFEVLRMPILEGRAFQPTDDSLHAPVAIVNTRAAQILWPGKSALGQRIRLRRGGPELEVVGIVPTSRYLMIYESPRPYLYLSFAQQKSRFAYLLTRTEQDPSVIMSGIPSMVGGVDRDLVPFGLTTMEDNIESSLNGLMLPRVGAAMAALLGVLALILTCVGLYGVVAYSVAQRSREIGLRMALGADRGRVIRSVVAGGGSLALIGVAIGAALALVITRPLSGMVVGVSTRDPLIFGGVAVILSLVALASAYIPALRASRIDPVRALKEDAIGG